MLRRSWKGMAWCHRQECPPGPAQGRVQPEPKRALPHSILDAMCDWGEAADRPSSHWAAKTELNRGQPLSLADARGRSLFAVWLQTGPAGGIIICARRPAPAAQFAYCGETPLMKKKIAALSAVVLEPSARRAAP